MALPLEQFVRQLEDTGIVAANTLGDFLPPKSDPKDADALALELVKHKLLTPFQADEIRSGNGPSLTVDNYVLLEKIGAGGMGQVFRARHKRLGRVVAVKLLSPGIVKDESAVARFEREVRAAAKISHPHIVAAYDAGCASGVHFLVMEYIEGSDLSVLVKKSGPLSLDAALNYVLQAARGLSAAHAEGIVHRDIKPANLLLDKTGTIKILDMGLARLQEDAAGQAELTSTGAVMGTVDYMAPEQALNTKAADVRADVYSLGCTLYYLLAGKPAFTGDTLMARLLAHREMPIPSLAAVRSDVPESVESVFQRMMAKSMVDRYQTMRELIADLEQIARGKSPKVNSQRGAGRGDADLTGLLNDITVASAVDTRPRGRRSAAANRQSSRAWLFIGGGVFGAAILLAGIVSSLRTQKGTLILRLSEPNVRVEILSEAGKVEMARQGEKGVMSLAVDPGKHRLQVTKEGFAPFTQEFAIASGGKETISARLVETEEDFSTSDFAASFLRFNSPEFQIWEKEVARLPVERQIEAVMQKLQEFNPGFDGKAMHSRVENGAVVELRFVTHDVTDISPVRALPHLQVLYCDGIAGAGRLQDLRPLHGMPLTALLLQGTQVSDLRPLQGMKLEVLAIFGTAVGDLSPLKEAPLKNLQCHLTKISDLTPLKGMPLTYLSCEDTLVTDLSPLKALRSLKGVTCDFRSDRDAAILQSIRTLETINGKPVTEFWKNLPALKQVEDVAAKLIERNPGYDGKVTHQIINGALVEFGCCSPNITDLSPVRELKGITSLYCGAGPFGRSRLSDLSALRELSLTNLNFQNAQVSDLTRLVGMPLESVSLHGNPITDLAPLRGKRLKYLHCDYTLVADISVLANMPLEDLSIAGCAKVSDLSPLTGAPLSGLNCSGTQIADLSPLKGMTLYFLDCSRTKVQDLSPLAGMRLNTLICSDTAVTDLSVIADMPLENIALDFKPDRDTALLRSIKSLQVINNQAAADFWKDVAARTPE